MYVPALLGLPDAVLGASLTIAWSVVLGIALYRNATGSRSRARTLGVATGASFWLAFGLLQFSTGLSGAPEVAAVALAAGLFCAGVVGSARWWGSRSGDGESATV